MTTAPSYVEPQVVVREKGPFALLMDFSFERMITPRLLKTLYGVHLLLGLIVAIWVVFSQFQTSIPNGLLALILCLAGMMLWIVYCRVFVELLAVAFRAGQVIATSQN
jgi:zinc transporter ZupT